MRSDAGTAALSARQQTHALIEAQSANLWQAFASGVGDMSNTRVREAIERLSTAIRAEPGKARSKNAPATARRTEGLKFDVTGPNHERMATDMPVPMGGDASAPNPAWFLRAGLASCAATVIAMRAANLGIALTHLEVTVESDSDLRGILGLDENVCAGLSAVRTKVRIG